MVGSGHFDWWCDCGGLSAAGRAGTKLGLWAFTGGFMLLAAGAVLATLASFLGVVAYIICLRKDFTLERAPILIGVLLGVGVGVIRDAVFQGQFGAADPQHINRYREPAAIRKDSGDPHSRESQSIGTRCSGVGATANSSVPLVKSLELMTPMDEAVDRAEAVMRGMGLEIVAVNKSTGLVEAAATTFWFGFRRRWR